MDELIIGGKQYISSRRAAEITGYAKDYIGQLCRGKRIEGKLVGRNWYVEPRSLLHLSAKKGNNSLSGDQGISRREEASKGAEILAESTFAYEPENVAYENDESPLVPVLKIARKESVQAQVTSTDTALESEELPSNIAIDSAEQRESIDEPVKVRKVSVKPSANAVDLRIMGLISDTKRRKQETAERVESRAETELQAVEKVVQPKVIKKRGVFVPKLSLVPALKFAVVTASLMFILGSVTDRTHVYPSGNNQYSISSAASLTASVEEGIKNLVKTR